MPLITVLTHTYNRPELLQRTVRSVLRQSLTDFEYILINNGSTDTMTEQLLDEYCGRDTRVRQIRLMQNDFGQRLNDITVKALLEHPESKYFAIVDDDDYMEPDWLAFLYTLAVQSDADIVTAGSRYVYSDGSMKNKYVFEGVYTYSRVEAMMELLRRQKINSARGGKLYKKSLLENVTYPAVARIRDIHREYRVMNNLSKMVVTGKPLYYFYRHSSNTSGLDTPEEITPEKLREHLQANRIRTLWLTKHMPEVEQYAYYCELSFMLSLWERIMRLHVEPCIELAQRMAQYVWQHSQQVPALYFTAQQLQQIDSIKDISRKAL